MSDISCKCFESVELLNKAVAALLRQHLEREYPGRHAVMLPGGRTPFDAYRLVADVTPVASSGLRIFLSDERLVPVTSAESNYGNMQFMFRALNLDEDRVIRPDPGLDPAASAGRYDGDLRKFINSGGVISLGLLGLGADGHTASLFRQDDLRRGTGRYAIPVVAPDGLNRISVTADLLAKIQQVVFVVAGPEKKAIVDKLIADPARVVAGCAVAGVRMKQLWFAM